MTSITFFFIFIPLLAVILLAINLIFAPHNPYQEKDSAFECGFHSFLGQNRTQFSISFFIFALLFLLFDLEIILIYPYAVSAYANHIYGLIIMLVFFVILTLGFAFELGKNALKIDSRQTFTFTRKQSDITTLMSGMQNYFKTIKSRPLRRFSTSPILKTNDNNKEDINKPSSISSTNENNNNENLNSPSPMSSTEYEAETERVDYDPKTWSLKEEADKHEGKSRKEIVTYFENEKKRIENESLKVKQEYLEDVASPRDMDNFNDHVEEENKELEKRLQSLEDVRQHVLDSHGLNYSSSEDEMANNDSTSASDANPVNEDSMMQDISDNTEFGISPYLPVLTFIIRILLIVHRFNKLRGWY